MPELFISEKKKNKFWFNYWLKILINFTNKIKPVKTKSKSQIQKIMQKIVWILYLLRKEMIIKTLNLRI